MGDKKLLLKEFLPALAALAEPVAASVAGKMMDKKLGEEKEDDLDVQGPELDVSKFVQHVLSGPDGKSKLEKVAKASVPENDIFEALGSMMQTHLGEAELEEDGYPDPDQWPSTEKPVYPRVEKEGMDVRDETSLHRDASGMKKEDGYPDPDQWPSTEKPVYPRVVKEQLPPQVQSQVGIQTAKPAVDAKAMVPNLMKMLTSMDANSLQQIAGMVPRIISMKQKSMGEACGEDKKEVKTESKKIKTKKQLKEALVESLVLRKKKSLVDRLVREQINEQIKVRNLTESLLTEGPLSSIWQGAKAAGRGLMGGAKGAVQGAQQAMAQGQQQDQGKQAQRTVMQALKSVERTRGKFNQETMKSADLVSQYHDAVVNLVNLLGQVQGMVGPMELKQLKNDVDQSVGQLYNDLSVEKQGLDGFLKSLNQSVPGTLMQGAKVKHSERMSADKARAETAPANLPSRTEGKEESESKSKKSKSKSKK